MRVFIAALIFISGCSAEEKPPEPGPENGGLRFRLVIENSRETVDRHVIKVEILNVSDKPVTLQAENRFEGGAKENYESYLRYSTVFEVNPKAWKIGFDIGGDTRKSPQPEAVIEPGKSVGIEWTVEGRQFDARNLRYTFSRVGRYTFTAEVTLKTKDGRDISLKSNAQPFIVGADAIWDEETNQKKK